MQVFSSFILFEIYDSNVNTIKGFLWPKFNALKN